VTLGTNNFTLTYDAAGNLTDDGEAYEYVYDGFGRLRQVKRTDNQNLVAEYWYNGLNHRITMHNDTDSDNDVDASDKKFHLAYTERWQIAATFRDTDSSAKESFIYHNAGLGGFGGSSKLDDVLIRDKDANTAWTTASDGTLEERRYLLHNWRGDVVVIVTDTGTPVEQSRYSPYGVPMGLPIGDVDADGDVDATDASQIQTWIDASQYHVRGDLDLDGDVDTADKTICTNNAGKSLGRGKLSHSSVRNRAGYGGYQLDAAIDSLYHVRHRVLNTTLGRWTRRDPLGYVDGTSVLEYASSSPLNSMDSSGLFAFPPGAPSVPPVCAHPLTGCVQLLPRPSHTPTSNGCSNSPDTYRAANFLPCCNAHDICYDTCGTNKGVCDGNFMQCLVRACRTAYPVPPASNSSSLAACLRRAQLYHQAASYFCAFWEDAQAHACMCCDPPVADAECTPPATPPSLPSLLPPPAPPQFINPWGTTPVIPSGRPWVPGNPRNEPAL